MGRSWGDGEPSPSAMGSPPHPLKLMVLIQFLSVFSKKKKWFRKAPSLSCKRTIQFFEFASRIASTRAWGGHGAMGSPPHPRWGALPITLKSMVLTQFWSVFNNKNSFRKPLAYPFERIIHIFEFVSRMLKVCAHLPSHFSVLARLRYFNEFWRDWSRSAQTRFVYYKSGSCSQQLSQQRTSKLRSLIRSSEWVFEWYARRSVFVEQKTSTGSAVGKGMGREFLNSHSVFDSTPAQWFFSEPNLQVDVR